MAALNLALKLKFFAENPRTAAMRWRSRRSSSCSSMTVEADERAVTVSAPKVGSSANADIDYVSD